jgi:LacI family transcriptional regulator
MKPQRPTLMMIAELSGVSRGTVDRVLNGRGKVKPEIAKRVEEIAKSLDYQPNTVAKSLATQRRDFKICAILHVQGNLFYDDVIKGIERAAAEIKDFGISVAVKRGVNFSVEAQLRNIDEAVGEGFRAIILIPISDPRIVARINQLSAEGIPVVYLTNFLDGTEYLCYVGCDYFKSGKMAAELFRLLAGDRARIGMISPPLAMQSIKLRLLGLKAAIETEYIGMSLAEVREIPNDDDLAYSQTLDMLRQHPDIDCLFYATGGVVGGFRAVRDLGLYRKLKIVSVDLARPIMDGINDGGILATICQEPEEQGYLAIKVAFDYLVSHASPQLKNMLIDPSIKIRQSF